MECIGLVKILTQTVPTVNKSKALSGGWRSRVDRAAASVCMGD